MTWRQRGLQSAHVCTSAGEDYWRRLNKRRGILTFKKYIQNAVDIFTLRSLCRVSSNPPILWEVPHISQSPQSFLLPFPHISKSPQSLLRFLYSLSPTGAAVLFILPGDACSCFVAVCSGWVVLEVDSFYWLLLEQAQMRIFSNIFAHF